MRPLHLRAATVRRSALAQRLAALDLRRKALEAEDRNLARIERALRRRTEARGGVQRLYVAAGALGVLSAGVVLAVNVGMQGPSDKSSTLQSRSDAAATMNGRGRQTAATEIHPVATRADMHTTLPRASARERRRNLATNSFYAGENPPPQDDLEVLDDEELASISQAIDGANAP